MKRLEAFEAMLSHIQRQAEYENEQMERLKAAGKEKTATIGNKAEIIKLFFCGLKEHIGQFFDNCTNSPCFLSAIFVSG